MIKQISSHIALYSYTYNVSPISNYIVEYCFEYKYTKEYTTPHYNEVYFSNFCNFTRNFRINKIAHGY